MGDDSKAALEWQVGVWDKMSEIYQREIDARFAPVIERLLAHADLKPGDSLVDLGTGTGSVAFAAAARAGDTGRITAVDISPEMLAKARALAAGLSLQSIQFEEGRAEAIPVGDSSQDVVLASLSLMYVIDRGAAAREIARILRPGGRFVGAVWAGPDTCDIVRFQQTAGSFAASPPVPGVGPGSLADPSRFLEQLSGAGLQANVERETTCFHFADFDSAWDALAGVTSATLEARIQDRAKAAVRELMWRSNDGAREFRNETLFILASKA